MQQYFLRSLFSHPGHPGKYFALLADHCPADGIGSEHRQTGQGDTRADPVDPEEQDKEIALFGIIKTVEAERIFPDHQVSGEACMLAHTETIADGGWNKDTQPKPA